MDELLIPSFFLLSQTHKKGCIVEAGSFKGSSTAKLSIIAKLTGRKLYIFDSFEGLPENNEPIAHTKLGYTCAFNKREYYGSLEEVKKNVKSYGELEACNFIKGWFEDTMPAFKEQINTVFCDVDLASSTKTCLKHLYPLLISGGRFFSQDAHIPEVIKVFNDKNFFENEVKTKKPDFYRYTKRFGCFIKN